MPPNQTKDENNKKPYSAKLLNFLGINTSKTVDYLLEWVDVLAVAALLAWLIMTFVTVRMTVPSESMVPTIQPHDSFFVDKISYNFREPERGDIIVFWHHREERGKKRYVKRLIAKGGDTVEIKNGDIYLNGEKLTGEEFDRRYWAKGEYGVGKVDVPEGKYYVLGDNSTNSFDSRIWGFADASTLIGEPYLRVWPPGRFGLIN
ncbi:signal peptidase I [Candidatus Bipolaricaulota bacterium]|nr:signal peptidase I [Candidatus Bipolaricaulota bacterium]